MPDIQLMRHPVYKNRKHTRIRRNNLLSALCRRVTVKSCLHIHKQHILNMRQPADKVLRRLIRLLCNLLPRPAFIRIQQRNFHLLAQLP